MLPFTTAYGSSDKWLTERALEHNQPLLLFHMACEHLQAAHDE